MVYGAQSGEGERRRWTAVILRWARFYLLVCLRVLGGRYCPISSRPGFSVKSLSLLSDPVRGIIPSRSEVNKNDLVAQLKRMSVRLKHKQTRMLDCELSKLSNNQVASLPDVVYRLSERGFESSSTNSHLFGLFRILSSL